MATVYRKLLKNSIIIPILLLILLALSVKYSAYKESGSRALSERKAEVLIINRDMGSELSSSFLKYLGRYCKLVVSDSSDAYLDYLSNIQYDFILDIPQYYQKEFMAGHNPVISMADTGKNEALPLKYMVDGYLGAAQAYLDENRNITTKELIKRLDSDMQGQVKVNQEQADRKYQNTLFMESFFLKASYALVLLCFFAIGRISSYFGVSGIRKKHEIAPISAARNNFRLLLSNFFFVLACNCIIFILMFLLKPEIGVSWNTFFYFMNFFVYSLCILGLCSIVSALAFKHGINIVLIIFFTAAMGFINGDLVRAGKESLVNIAEFTPVYWFKNINNQIGLLNSFAWTGMHKILYMLGVNILIAGAYFSVSLVINKSRTERI
ncbi:hypothetical protein SAMN02745136_00993 [Anaerocolumna jejuensis DSM 15929]|uniref:ABC-2 family transporter protein n=1 Tax=Anaerocolumna jejuensis DSM 15929 TaxID=1121322 RepID=A0A1M6MFY7_9FIRM|nr:hypothetical protein [Anaerocolumna jejuensis]SHJ82381.1 hypothetical protein SAMN02745136_00993 [Anaerocolumna jejuensis DSM 15929]